MTGRTPRVAVVIPHFQRESGLLERALRSAASQERCEPFDVIVIDDASPSPAAIDVARVALPPGIRVRVITQQNAGPSVARNTALDHVAAGTEYVAFLDSDDEWSPSHLANALDALDRGYDFYFADYRPLHASRTMFAMRDIRPGQHARLSADRPFHRYEGDFFDDILRKGHVGAPTVVYRYAKFLDMRFPRLVTSGDNYLWLKLALRTDAIVFSSEVEVTCGAGVNVFAGSGWGSEGALVRACNDLRFRRALLREFPLTPQQVRATREVMSRRRAEFLESLLHRLYHRKRVDARVVRDYFVADPAAVPCMVPVLLRMALRRRA